MKKPNTKRLDGTSRQGMQPGYIQWIEPHNKILREIYNLPIPMAEVCARVGHPQESVYKQAMRLGLKRPERLRFDKRFGENTLRALELGARPQGVGANEMEMEGGKAATFLCKQVKKGKLFRCSKGLRVRYFTTQAGADAYAEVLPSVSLPKGPKAKNARAGWGPNDPPIFTPQTKYTIAPPPPAQVFRTNTYSL
jgi:hypothetical protein